jgi:hypothetical protein
MSVAANRRPGIVIALIALTAFQALGAIGGGIGLIQDPIKNIGIPLSILQGSPFKDYLIPGIILLVLVGLFPLVPLYGLIRRRRWGWWLELAAGGALIIWIIAEIAMLGYLPGMGVALQAIMGVVGVAVVTLTLLAPTRRYCGIGKYRTSR